MTNITINTNDPYVVDVEGLSLQDKDGKAIPLPQSSKVVLRRCGQ